MDALIKIPKQEGVSALFLGLVPTTIGYMLQGAAKFGGFEFLKSSAVSLFGADFCKTYDVPVYITASAIAESIATTALCPWEAVRVRAVAAKLSPTAKRTNMFSTMHQIYKQEGFANGFYKGLVPILLKQVPYTVVQMTTFSKLVDYFYSNVLPTWTKQPQITKQDLTSGQQLMVSTACGAIAGVVSAIASHPPDTIFSRLNAKKWDQPTDPKGSTKQIIHVARELGFRGLWLGLGLRCFMVGTLSAGMFLIYDSVKVAVGLSTTSGLQQKQE